MSAPVRRDKRAFVRYKGALSARLSPPGAETYTWPSSCAMVKEELRPFSSLIEQLRYGSHIVPSSAKPTGTKHTPTHTKSEQDKHILYVIMHPIIFSFTYITANLKMWRYLRPSRSRTVKNNWGWSTHLLSLKKAHYLALHGTPHFVINLIVSSFIHSLFGTEPRRPTQLLPLHS